MDRVKSDVVLVDEFSDPVSIAPEDHSDVMELQVLTDNLIKIRQEIGRLSQAMNNLIQKANEVEVASSEKRRSLVTKYHLEQSPGQWAVDFEKKHFVKVDSKAPVIP